jgi:hypothetical protein
MQEHARRLAGPPFFNMVILSAAKNMLFELSFRKCQSRFFSAIRMTTLR